MEEIDNLRNALTEYISNTTSEPEVIEAIDTIRMALKNTSVCKKQLATLKPQLNRLLSKNSKGTLTHENQNLDFNRIISGAIEMVSNIKRFEIGIAFEYDEREGLIFHFCNTADDLSFKYSGKLENCKPSGHGKAKYNGT